MARCLQKFYVDFEKRLRFAEEEMKDVEIEDEIADENCENVAGIWSIKWVDLANLWPAPDFQNVAIRSQS